MSSYADITSNTNWIATYGSRQLDEIRQIEQLAIDTMSGAVPSGASGNLFQVRPLRADDITTISGATNTNLAAAGAKELFVASSATAGNNGASTTFTVPPGRRFVFYGVRNLTPGTKNLSGIQFVINGKNTPLFNGTAGGIPLTRSWTDEESSVYFNPVKADADTITVVIQFNFLAATSVETWQLLGYYGQVGSQ